MYHIETTTVTCCTWTWKTYLCCITCTSYCEWQLEFHVTKITHHAPEKVKSFPLVTPLSLIWKYWSWSTGEWLPTALEQQLLKSSLSVWSSEIPVRFHSNFWTEWPLILTRCMCTDHDHCLMGLRRFGITVQKCGPLSSVKDAFLVSCWNGSCHVD